MNPKKINGTLILTLLTSLIFSSLLSSASNAQSLTAKRTDQIFEEVKLTESVLLENNGAQSNLNRVSYALRTVKKFGLVTVSVYVIEFFAKNPNQLLKTDEAILSSLKLAGPVQLRLTLARDLKGSQITESFKDALKANEIDSTKTTAELTSVLAVLNEITQFKKGDVFSLTIDWKDNVATLFIQRPDQSIQKITGPEKFATDLFSIWFGKPVDAKMDDLKKTLLK